MLENESRKTGKKVDSAVAVSSSDTSEQLQQVPMKIKLRCTAFAVRKIHYLHLNISMLVTLLMELLPHISYSVRYDYT